jgi:hypothetical protein
MCSDLQWRRDIASPLQVLAGWELLAAMLPTGGLLAAAGADPAEKAAGKDTGGEHNGNSLQWLLLDGVARIVDSIFGRGTPLLECLDRSLNTLLDRFGNDRLEAGNFPKNIVDCRLRFIQYA